MTPAQTLKQFINTLPGVVVLRSELAPSGIGQAQLTRALRTLTKENFLQRISHGAYVKTRFNQFLAKPTPAAPLEVVAHELFEKLQIKVSPPPEVIAYNEGLSTQVPAGCRVVVEERRITRKITVSGRTVQYVKTPKKP